MSSSSVLIFVFPHRSSLRCGRIVQDLGVLGLPPIEALLFGVRFAVDLKEGQELLQQAVAGELEGNRLSSRNASGTGCGSGRRPASGGPPPRGRCSCPAPCTRPAGSKSGDVNRGFFRRRLSRTARGADHRSCGWSTRRPAGALRSGNDGGRAGLADLALPGIGTTALDDKMAEDLIGGQQAPGLGQVLGDVESHRRRGASAVPSPFVEVGAQVVHPQGPSEVGLVPPRE